MRIDRLILTEFIRRLGRPGAAGAVLLALAAGYGLFGVLPGVEARDAAEARALNAEARLARIRSGAEAVAEAPARQMESFHQALPAQPDATAAIDRIYAAAAREGLSLARGEYALQVDPDTRLVRYQLLLPLHGSYPQLRRFLGSALAEVPTLALEEVEFQRKEVTESQLEARVRMTLYLGRP